MEFDITFFMYMDKRLFRCFQLGYMHSLTQMRFHLARIAKRAVSLNDKQSAMFIAWMAFKNGNDLCGLCKYCYMPE